MIRASTFAGKRVAVFGLGASGKATASALLAGGADVAAWDDGEASRAAAAKAGIPIIDLEAADWSTFSALVLAPGVPLTHPEPHWTVQRARAAGIEVIGDVEVFFRERAALFPDAPVIAITGTNGKSTTTALVAHMLQQSGRDAQMGGNIGVPVLALEPFAPGRIYVLELSSFQIDLTPSVAPTVGVLLNLSPDHLDRHGPADQPEAAMQAYAAIKERLVMAAQVAAIGVEDTYSRAILERVEDTGRETYPFTTGKGAAIVPRLYAIGATLFAHEQHASHASSTEIASLDGVGTLRGRHNVQNALAALAALRALEGRINPATASDLAALKRYAAAIRTYAGLPHRMEEVGRSGRVAFINDSKATNADSTEKALASWDRDIYWILGGKPKEGGITSLTAYFPRIAKAYLIGAATEEFAATLDGRVPFVRAGTLDAALKMAAADAAKCTGPEPVVLLSPACASYDQFRSFEHRGNVFRDLVRDMTGWKS